MNHPTFSKSWCSYVNLLFHSASALIFFSPCPPPRFDTFSENLVRSWTTPDSSKLVVEEVMRSCGGAVQGIREVPLTLEDAEGTYLNRANDGFLFVDNGIYSCGPIEWQKQEEEKQLLLSSFAISETSRLVLTTEMTSSFLHSSNDSTTSGLFLRKTFGGADDPILECTEIKEIVALSPVEFCKGIRCSMPSRGQPWMLQRAKWEKFVNNDDTGGDNKDVTITTGSLKYWTVSQPTTEFLEWSGLSALSPIETGDSVNSGILSEESGIVKTVARSYDDNGILKSVSFLEGRVH